jgi:hypothetical protein
MMATSATTQTASPMIFSWDGGWCDVWNAPQWVTRGGTHDCLDATRPAPTGGSLAAPGGGSISGVRTLRPSGEFG